MQGGTVVLATSPFDIELNRTLAVKTHVSGLEDWLAYHGVKIEEKMVLDPQNSAFPVPVQRNLGGFTVQETRLVNYPYFVDIRPDAMNQESGMVSGLNQVTLNWASPVTVDQEINKERRVISLLESSPESWLSAETNIQPDFKTYGELGFKPGDEKGRHLLGVVLEGRFTSYFKGKPSPLLSTEAEKTDSETDIAAPEEIDAAIEVKSDAEKKEQVISRMIDKSPESARIIIFASNSFLTDTLLGIGSSVRRTDYLGPVQLAANAVDWSLEDRGLLEMRGRSHFSRPLVPMTMGMQVFWEYCNYGLALAGLVLVWLLKIILNKKNRKRQALFVQNIGRI
jgi:ABC-2 type transport system permease protein